METDEHDENREEIMQVSLGLMRLHRLWPPKGKELNPGKAHYLKIILVMISTSSLLLGTLLHLIHTIAYHVDIDYSEDLTILCSVTALTYIDLLFGMQCSKTGHLLYELSRFKKFGKPPQFEEKNSRLNALSKYYIRMVGITILTYVLLAYQTQKSCEKLNEKKNLHENCGLPVPVWLPISVNYSPAREIVIIVQVASALVVTRSGATICYTILEISEHILLRIDHLKILLEDAINNDKLSHRQKQRKFHHCIEYHLYIMSLVDQFGDCYKYITFIHLILTGLTHGCLINEIYRTVAAAPLLHLLSWQVAFFVVCLGGQRLLDESESLYWTVCGLNWCNARETVKKDMVIFLTKLRKPLVLPAGPLGIISFELYVAVMKTAFSYWTLLREKVGTN